MKYIVDLYVGGKVFKEEVQATNPKNARETALAHYIPKPPQTLL